MSMIRSNRWPALCAALAFALAGCAGAPAPEAPATDAAATDAAATHAAATDARAAAIEAPVPPVAARIAHTVSAPAGERDDPYYWLRDDSRKDPRMLAYLEAENAYTDAVLRPLEGFERALYEEILARVQQDDATVPYRWKGDWYYTRYSTGSNYPVHARRRGSMDAPEQVLLDVNAMAEGKDFFQVANWQVSPDTRLLAWAEDSVGRRQFTLRVKNLETGEVYADAITGASASLAWADDNRTLYYIENDPVTLLTRRVKAHVLGTDPAQDRLVYEEQDTSFYMGLGRTRSDAFVCIFLRSTVSSEQRCADAADPRAFRTLAPRQRDFEYRADHLDGRWVVRTNWDAPNFRLMQFADADAFAGRERWRELMPHADDVFINDFELFDGFHVVDERSDALRRLRVVPARGEPFFVASDEPAYTMSLSTNAEPDTAWLRYEYASMTTPDTIYEMDVTTGERRLLKRDPVLGDFDPADYVTERLWAPARDGERIPVSVVYRRGTPLDGSAPLFQYAYGSYGSSMDPVFSSPRLSLLDRGVVFAIAHVRGGQELGRRWYEGGRLLNKMNSFTDFIDVTDFLVAQGYGAAGRVAAQGGSAGGLLIGAVANLAPEKYRVMHAAVPFVDVVTTMLDETIPLTTNEFDEWGNPKDPDYYAYMLSYSPYDNVAARDYPALLVTTGLWDSQVQYFEPAKWVARLRATKTDDNPLLFRVNMEAGHGGKSGRLRRFEEIAEQYAFVLDQLGVAH